MEERIREMEARLNRAGAAVRALEEALEAYRAVREDVAALAAYYDSPQWLADYDREETLPAELPRGVLSQDGIYDLLTADEELRREMRALAEEKGPGEA